VLARTGSPLATGLAAFANSLPLIFAGAVGGVWVDRLGGRAVSVASDLSAGVVIGLVPLLDHGVGLPMPVLLGLLFARTVVATPAAAARVTLLAPMAEAAGVRLASVTSWYQAAPRLGLVVGAPLAALLVAKTGTTTGLYVDAASFLVGAALVALTPGAAARTPAPGPAGARPGLFASLREGAAAIRALPVVAALTAFVFVTNVLDDAFTPVILPVYARDATGDPRWLGWYIAASGVGALVGTFGYAPASRRFLTSRRWTMLGCFAAIGGLRVTMGALPGPVAMCVLCGLLGIASGPLNPVLTTVILERVPERLRGRVFGLGAAVAMSGAPVGVLLAGAGADGPGLRFTLVAFGAAYLVMVLISVRMRSLRGMDSADALGLAAVDQQAGAGDEAGGPAGQERHDVAEVAGVADAAERDAGRDLGQARAGLGAELPAQARRVVVAGRDDVDGDLAGAERRDE
jgi:MFS family permease